MLPTQSNTLDNYADAPPENDEAADEGTVRFPVVYLSGPMSGIEDYNFPAFNSVADKLRLLGFPVLNPADFGADPEVTWEECLVRDLGVMAHADIVVTLDGWEESKGASLEVQNAKALGIPVMDLDEFTAEVIHQIHDPAAIEQFIYARLKARMDSFRFACMLTKLENLLGVRIRVEAED